MPIINNKYHLKPVELVESKLDEIMEAMKVRGALPVQIASILDISLPTLKTWMRRYKEIGEIMELGLTHSMSWWVERGKSGLNDNRFNVPLWIATMKNSWGWGDKPSDRTIDIQDWHGTMEEKINALDRGLQEGIYAADFYEKMMRSLASHAMINEIIYVQPTLQRLELDRLYKEGTITKDEYDVEMKVLDRMEALRKNAADLIFKEGELYSKFPKHAGDAPNPNNPKGSVKMHRSEEFDPERLEEKMKNISMSASKARLEKIKQIKEKRAKKMAKLQG